VGEPAVINASPLIFLSRARHLGLLQYFAQPVLVPEPVAEEVRRKGPADVSAKAMAEAPWLEIVSTPAVPQVILEWGLGRGESSVLAIALSHHGMEAIVDDLVGRKCARSLGIPVRGTLGIVLVAKKRGLIPSARSVMEDLIGAGLYLSPRVLADALSRVGE